MKPRNAAANQPLMITTTEMAEYLQVNRSTIYRMIRNGDIPCFKIGSDYRFDAYAIDKWMIRRTKGEALKKTG